MDADDRGGSKAEGVHKIELPLAVAGAITYAGATMTDNIMAIIGITCLLVVAMICQPFDQANMFALTMSGISGIAALAGYEIGKRSTTA